MTTPLPPTPRCDAEVYESGPTAANYGINDPDVVVDYTFAQQLEREVIAANQARADLEAENTKLREALKAICDEQDTNEGYTTLAAYEAASAALKGTP